MDKILTPLQVKVLEKIYKTDRYTEIAKEFFLTGGTALAAFYLHHRESIDLDFFSMTDKPFHSHRYLVNVMEQLSGDLNCRLSILDSFFNYHKFELTDDKSKLLIDFTKDTADNIEHLNVIDGIKVSSIRDIAANKIRTITSRCDAKDFIDIYFMNQIGGIELDSMIESAIKKQPSLNAYAIDKGFSRFLHVYEHNRAFINFPKVVVPFKIENFKLKIEEMSNHLSTLLSEEIELDEPKLDLN